MSLKRARAQLARVQELINNTDPKDDTKLIVKQRTPQRCSNCHQFKKAKGHDPQTCVKCTNRDTCPTAFDNGHPAFLATKRVAQLTAKIEEMAAKDAARAKERERRKQEKEEKERQKKAKRERAAEGRASAPSLAKFLATSYELN
jgi:hypothetical protein